MLLGLLHRGARLLLGVLDRAAGAVLGAGDDGARVLVRLAGLAPGVLVGVRPDAARRLGGVVAHRAGLVLGQPQHALEALREPLHGVRRRGEPVDLGPQVLDVRAVVVQRAGELGGLGHRGVAVGGEDPQVGLDAVEVLLDLAAVVAAAHDVEAGPQRQQLVLVGRHAGHGTGGAGAAPRTGEPERMVLTPRGSG